MINKKLILAAMMSVAVVPAFAADQDQNGGNPVNVSVDARVRYERDAYAGDDNLVSDIKADDVNVTLTADLSSKIRAKIRANLAPFFKDTPDAQAKLEQAIEEATIEIREIEGTPIAAVILGKQRIAFGDLDDTLPGYKQTAMYQLLTKDQVIGVTVELQEVLGFAISVSAFENSSGDLKFGDGWGYSIEATHQLNKNLQLRGSAMMMQRGTENEYGDKRMTLGAVYTNDDGSFTAHLDGIWFKGQASPAGATKANTVPAEGHGVQAGASAKAGVGTIRVSASYLEKTAYEVAAAYDIPVTDNLVISPALRYTTDKDGKNGDTRAMVEARVRYGQNPQQVK